ncbi:type IV toxin-antitoxin system AbiEi family antitoxin [Paraburkholderia sp. J67]|uniref:type IV toxin-antitoxin system AbiEi family antitoxin n=1 Tax=Paraburkholderia sp. J67 TaxID=2805435 RepID=UPI002ABE256C|nr:type IV toxin-antitoxin system AbiEi family antitoxin [Paraburkholderia sp. J67]
MSPSPVEPHPLIEAAAQAFSAVAGIETRVSAPPPGTDYDGVVAFELAPRISRLARVVPSIDRQERLAAATATDRMQDSNGFLLVTSYLTPALVDACRALGIDAIDASGNAFLREQSNLILISGRPRATVAGHARRGLWSRRSLQVILALLVKPALLDQGRREIADFAKVSLGTAQSTLQTLLQRRDLIQRSDGSMAIADYGRLLDEWVTLYPSLLRQAQQLGRYRAAEPDWWRAMPSGHAAWMFGGEPAAARMTQYLKPEMITVYSEKGLPRELMTRARLRPDPAGNVEILTAPVKLEPTAGLADDLIYPALVYADLVASADSRNLETARLIRNQYLDHADQAAG